MSVERRIQESEAADRDLLKQLSDLHALDPAPPDLDTLFRRANGEAGAFRINAQNSSKGAHGQRRGGTRMAEEKLTSAESELAVVEKNIARTRSELKHATENCLRVFRPSNRRRATRRRGIRPWKSERILRI